MRHLDKVHYQGMCDRLHCAKQYNHAHPPEGTLKPENDRYRRRKPAFYTKSGRMSNTMTNEELIKRLLKLPLDSIVSVEENELYTTKDDKTTTIIDTFAPIREDFDKDHELIGE